MFKLTFKKVDLIVTLLVQEAKIELFSSEETLRLKLWMVNTWLAECQGLAEHYIQSPSLLGMGKLMMRPDRIFLTINREYQTEERNQLLEEINRKIKEILESQKYVHSHLNKWGKFM